MDRRRTRTLFRLQRILVVVWAFMLITSALMPAGALQALSNNFILSDTDLLDANAMSAERIQRFLEARGSFLATYSLDDAGTTKRAADLLAEISSEYSLSPKFFLTMLQKEQSLMTDPSPSQNQLDYALGYGCPSTCSSAYKGFATQLRAAGKRIHDDYLPTLREKGQFNGWGPGIAKLTIDDILVTPANIATAVLYIYNPYVGKYGGGDQRYGANSLFQQLWLRWFVRKHPDGSLLRVRGEPGIWLIRDGKRSAFLSRSAFLGNYDPQKVIVVDRDEIETYDIGIPIRYPEPSLLQLRTGGIYLLANGMKRPLASRETLRVLGYNPEEIIRGVDASELEIYPKGDPITEQDAYPTGRLLQSEETGGIVSIGTDGKRHAIYSKEIYRSQFRNQRSQRTTEQELLSFPEGEPVKFRDGEIVASRTERKIYFISNGERRPIPDLEAFRGLGLRMKNLVWTNDRSIAAHALGETLSDVATRQGS